MLHRIHNVVARGFIIAVVCIIAASAYALQTTPSSVPNPTVTGPVAATALPGDSSHGYPFFATTVDLASRGYIEEEFFFSGTASAYTISDPLAAGVLTPGSTLPYVTRMVVRRPIAADNFNGIVVLEWQNVTSGYDFDALWLQSWEHMLRKGYAWVGVSAQPMGLIPPFGLKKWSPNRYAPLTIPNDSLAFDIFSQAAQAVRHPVGADVVGGLPVSMIIAAGASQSANRLVTYYNSIHPLAGVVDGFYIIAGGDKLRTDLDVKAFKLLTETDVAGNLANFAQVVFRQEQSDRFRRWEIAGTAHLDYHFKWEGLNALQVRDGMPATPPVCTNTHTFSRIPVYFAANAALDHLVNWVRRDLPPPIGEDLPALSCSDMVDPITNKIITTTCTLARDSFGNALGGIRLSQHEVPTATNTGVNLPGSTACRMLGTSVPFDAATISALYPDHQTYLGLVIKATHDSQQSGFIVGADAAATIRDAANSTIGRPE